ncbi:hypothetical protein OG225_32985 [Nocardia sp. NBC_01377]|uniref:hypothetical protein n=1 Tax=Nocardia sp. NBC_01377 TaxID=2903595 RepID=UPI0032468B0C
MTDVRIRRTDDGLQVIAPADAPTVLDGTPDPDTLALEVVGGHLTWSLLAGQPTPAAVIDHPDDAQEWLWAVYGEAVALAAADRRAADRRAVELPALPARPDLVAKAWRLAYAHWAIRWWPASTIDGIAALDRRLLEEEIATLTEACDALVDGADAEVPDVAGRTADAPARQDDYALAAGGDGEDGGLTLTRGVGGWDWRGCPPGLVDASERAVSWEVTRDSGTTRVLVRAVAAPDLVPGVPDHLRPRAIVGTAGDADAILAEIALSLVGDTWVGRGPVGPSPTVADPVTDVGISVAGFGPPGFAAPDETEIRRRVRDLATARLARAADADNAAFDAPLLAEIAAAASDSDF